LSKLLLGSADIAFASAVTPHPPAGGSHGWGCYIIHEINADSRKKIMNVIASSIAQLHHFAKNDANKVDKEYAEDRH
jgi:hypothetical protein